MAGWRDGGMAGWRDGGMAKKPCFTNLGLFHICAIDFPLPSPELNCKSINKLALRVEIGF